MADQQQQKRQKKKGGGGPPAKVFVAKPSGDAVSAGSKPHTYNVTVRFGINPPNPNQATLAKIFIQDKEIDLVQAIALTTEKTFSNVKLDLTKKVVVRIEKAGNPTEKDEVEFSVDEKQLKHSAPAHEAAKADKPKRLEVHVFGFQNGRNLVRVITRDANLQPVYGIVRIPATKITISGTVCENQMPEIKTGDSGNVTHDIEVEETRLYTFEHVESGERVQKLLASANDPIFKKKETKQ